MKLLTSITRSLTLVALTVRIAQSLPYLSEEANWNLNQNQTATNPLDYSGQWDGHSYTPSPDNWRFPFYTIFLDRLVNGDPSNDDANGTQWEHILTSNQFRHGGDVLGLVDTFDYLQGMKIKVRLRCGKATRQTMLTMSRAFILQEHRTSTGLGALTDTPRLI